LDDPRRGSHREVGIRRALHPADLRGIAQLAADGTIEATNIVEGMHEGVLSAVLPATSRPVGQTRGLTGWIYRTIRRFARLSGYGTAAVIQAVEQAIGSVPPPDTDARRRFLSALNGVLGDHLADTGNPLARSFTLRRSDGSVFDPRASGAASGGDTWIVFVHGLCLDDRNWMPTADRTGHVAALSEAVDGTAIFTRYNTGRPIAANGRLFSRHLESLAVQGDADSRIVLVAHSMGGLVVRSALASAGQQSACWPGRVQDIVYIGTPHRGAPLERIGAWVERSLRWSRFTEPFTALTGMRSEGIQDLHSGAGPAGFSPDAGTLPSTPPMGRCLYVAGDLAPGSLASESVGDGLVPVSSALDRPSGSRDNGRNVFANVSHFDLLHDPSVTRYLANWLQGSAGAGS
jgi:pimeloyl-ACP methyl ester carboxylesterase